MVKVTSNCNALLFKVTSPALDIIHVKKCSVMLKMCQVPHPLAVVKVNVHAMSPSSSSSSLAVAAVHLCKTVKLWFSPARPDDNLRIKTFSRRVHITDFDNRHVNHHFSLYACTHVHLTSYRSTWCHQNSLKMLFQQHPCLLVYSYYNN